MTVSQGGFTSPVTDVSRRLREHRLRAGLSISDLAITAGVARSTLSRIENGRILPSQGVLRKVGQALNVSGQTLESLVEIASSQLASQRLPEVNVTQQQFMALEAGAKILRSVAPLIPALLQTPPYVRRLLEHTAEWFFDSVDEDTFVVERVRRQALLQDRTRSFTFLFPARAVEDTLLPERQQQLQLAHLLEVAQLGNVEVLLSDEQTVGPLLPDLAIFDEDAYFLELPIRNLWERDRQATRRFVRTFEHLRSLAWSAQRSIDWLSAKVDSQGAAGAIDLSNSPAFTAATKASHSS